MGKSRCRSARAVARGHGDGAYHGAGGGRGGRPGARHAGAAGALFAAGPGGAVRDRAATHGSGAGVRGGGVRGGRPGGSRAVPAGAALVRRPGAAADRGGRRPSRGPGLAPLAGGIGPARRPITDSAGRHGAQPVRRRSPGPGPDPHPVPRPGPHSHPGPADPELGRGAGAFGARGRLRVLGRRLRTGRRGQSAVTAGPARRPRCRAASDRADDVGRAVPGRVSGRRVLVVGQRWPWHG